MAEKKGQLTLFIILGIVILLTFSALVYINMFKVKSRYVDGIDVSALDMYITMCLKSTSYDALEYVSSHGGYYNLDSVPEADYFGRKTAYFFYSQSNIMPSKETVQQEMSDYIDENIGFCLRHYDGFRAQGFNVEQRRFDTKVSIYDNIMSYEVDSSIIIKRSDQSAELKSFIFEAKNVRFGKMISLAQNLTALQETKPEFVPMLQIFQAAADSGMSMEMINMGNQSVLFRLKDMKSDPEITFIYAYRYGAE